MPAPKISSKCAAAIGHLVEGRAKTQAQAARLAGMDPANFSRAVRRPAAQRFLLAAATKHLRGVPLALAVARLSKLVNAKSEDVAARVATRIAESAGAIGPNAPPPTSTGGGPVLQVVFKHFRPEDGSPLAPPVSLTAIPDRPQTEHEQGK